MEITQWQTNGRDYADGVAIYAKTKNPNLLLLRQFQRKKTKYLEEKLAHELSKLVSDTVIPKKKEKPIELQKSAPRKPIPINLKEKKPKLMMHHLPAELRPVYAEAHALFLENCRLKVELNETPGTKNTYDLQVRMEDNWKRNQWCWNQIAFWKENGFLPKTEPSEFEKLNAAQLVKRQQLKWQQISKAEKYISDREKKLKDDNSLKDRVKLETQIRTKKEKLLQFEAEIIELKNLIDNER